MNISLWGFMGAGKSTVARALSQCTGIDVLDTDQEIERREGRRIQAIFAENGEAYFRQLETMLLRDLIDRPENPEPLILSTGGGMPLRDENRALLKVFGVSVYLHVPFEEIAQRLAEDKERPLWTGKQTDELRAKYEERLSWYRLADVTLDGSRTPAEIACEITQLISE